jgi:hypothetical protein
LTVSKSEFATSREPLPTFATEEEDRECLLLVLDLSLERGRDGGSELVALIVGMFVRGNKLPPGLADRESRGQAISCQFPHKTWVKTSRFLLSLDRLYR